MCLSTVVRTDFMLLQYVFESLQLSHLQEETLKREGSDVQTGPASYCRLRSKSHMRLQALVIYYLSSKSLKFTTSALKCKKMSVHVPFFWQKKKLILLKTFREEEMEWKKCNVIITLPSSVLSKASYDEMK